MFERIEKIFENIAKQYYVKKLLERNYARNRNRHIEIEAEFPKTNLVGRRVILLTERDELFGRAFFLKSLGAEIVHGLPEEVRGEDVAILFGYSSLRQHAKDLYRSQIKDILFFEAGFLRSVLLNNSTKPDDKFDQSTCFFVDDLGFHFDSTSPSRIIEILNDPEFKPSEAELARAKELRRRIVDTRLTKYNDQSESVNLPPKTRPRVLVVEQARGDWAVVKSGGSRSSFRLMLRTAIVENPDAEIVIKVHPDSLDGKRGGLRRSYYGRLKEGGQVVVIREKVNPFTLLESVDKVYVFSSMLGFEAAMMGKETHIFGKPCYAGWGVTHDRSTFERRSRPRSMDEIFFAIYFRYQKYKALDGTWSTAEEAVTLLLALRERFREEITDPA